MSKWIIGTLLFVVATVTWAQTKKSDPRLQYVGAITINSPNPKALSAWYTEKLGLDASSEYHGLYYGSFSTKSGDFNLGIHPIPAGAKVGTPNISITFHEIPPVLFGCPTLFARHGVTPNTFCTYGRLPDRVVRFVDTFELFRRYVWYASGQITDQLPDVDLISI